MFTELNDFAEAVKKELGTIFSDCELMLHDVTKNNGIMLKGITIRKSDSHIAPQIYLNNFYEEYQDGIPIEDICAEIADIYNRQRKHAIYERNMSQFTDFEHVKDKICFRLVNAKKNQEQLQTMPHRKFLDLAVTYCIPVDVEADRSGSIKITEEFMKQWNVSEQTLYELAVRNTPVYSKGMVTPLSMIMSELLKEETEPVIAYKSDLFDIVLEENDLQFYVAANQENVYGAAVILYSGLLEQVGEYLGEFYLLPSSVHEMLLLKKTDEMQPTELLQMVREVNAKEVLPEEVLSDNVYLYDTKNKKLRMFTE